jgi:F0F1-type ATP synthase assembly protein I
MSVPEIILLFVGMVVVGCGIGWLIGMLVNRIRGY